MLADQAPNSLVPEIEGALGKRHPLLHVARANRIAAAGF
jgi:hypothetical protein